MVSDYKVFSLDTKRLLLRQFRENDAADLYKLNADPLVMQYTGDSAFTSTQDARKFIKNYDSYTRYGMGRWAVLEKSTGTFLGWCGLKFDPEMSETDLGFRFLREHWNKGFATESSTACLHYGFETRGLKEIVGRVATVNSASTRVLEKLGMTYSGPIKFDGVEGSRYCMTSLNFLSCGGDGHNPLP